MNYQESSDIFDQMLQEYELRLRVYRRRQNLRYCMLGCAIGSFLFWAFWAAIWL